MAHDRSSPRPDHTAALPDALANARPAGFLRRAGGFVIDWTLAFFVPSLVSSFALVFLSEIVDDSVLTIAWFVLLAAFVGFYFTHFAMAGQSPGMRMMGIQVVDAATGQPPSYGQALVRGILTLLFIASGPPQLYFLFNDPSLSDFSARERTAIDALTSISVITTIGYLWMAWDRRRRTLQDKIAGLAIIRVPAPPPSGPRSDEPR